MLADNQWRENNATRDLARCLQLRHSRDLDIVTAATVCGQSDDVGAFSNVCFYLRNAAILLRACPQPDSRRIGPFAPWSPSEFASTISEALADLIVTVGDTESDAWENIQPSLDYAESALVLVGYSTVWHEGITVVDLSLLNGRQRRMVEDAHYSWARPDKALDAEYSDYVDFRNHTDPERTSPK